MKSLLILIFFIFNLSGIAQTNNQRKPISSNSACEDLVFNTRELTQFAYNTPCKTESYPYLSEDGNHMYYTNNQTYDWLFYTHRDTISGVWSVPVPLNIANYLEPIRSCYVSKDFKELYFTNQSGLFKCDAIDDTKTNFSMPVSIEITENLSLNSQNKRTPFSNLSFSPDMQEMYAYTSGSMAAPPYTSMAVYKKVNSSTYQFDKFISTTKNEMGTVAKNGLIYYFTNDEQENFLFCRKRNTVTEDFGQEVYTVKIFESHLNIGQFRLAEKTGTLVMVLSESVWEKNDIFFYNYDQEDSAKYFKIFNLNAFNTSIQNEAITISTLVDEKDAPEPLRKVEIINQTGKDIAKIEIGIPFPNPARNQFSIYYNVSGDNSKATMPVIVLLDLSGRVVYTRNLEDMYGEVTVIPENLASGVYYVRIDFNGLSSATSKITLSM